MPRQPLGRRCLDQIGDVRFGSKADIEVRLPDVRFTPKADIVEREWNVRFVPKADIA